jgi:hypothetical protein
MGEAERDRQVADVQNQRAGEGRGQHGQRQHGVQLLLQLVLRVDGMVHPVVGRLMAEYEGELCLVARAQ